MSSVVRREMSWMLGVRVGGKKESEWREEGGLDKEERRMDSGRWVEWILRSESWMGRKYMLLLLYMLQDECGVTEVYFAMDPETGISSQAEGDPWKWAQEATDKVSGGNGHILILASPPKNMGLNIYKDFGNKQAYISTKVLQEMEAKGSVSVAAFPYSVDPAESLPSVLPDHLKHKRLIIPKQMNTLLCQIHRIKKKPICPCVPLALIEPDVSLTKVRLDGGGKGVKG